MSSFEEDRLPELREHVPLAPYTTIGLGGPARFFVDCASEGEIKAALDFAESRGLRVLVLGGGSNLLLPDRGWDGLVLRVALKGIADVSERLVPAGAPAKGVVLVQAGAGENWDDFVRHCVEAGLAGIECLSGIPGLVGGTPIQNVGAYGQEVGARIAAVRVLDRTTRAAREIPGADCAFAYRMSRFKGADRDRFIVTRVTFALFPNGPPDIRYEELRRVLARANLDGLAPGREQLAAVRAAVLALRRGKSMVYDPGDPDSHSLGSFFMNPVLSRTELEKFLERLGAQGIADDPPQFAAEGGVKVPAAWLIERAGFPKGFRLGGAGISGKHALALVNRGGSAAEVRELARRIQAGVRERFGVELVPEPVVLE